MKSAHRQASRIALLRDREGFTLIRLLVTIGILGILLAAASPNIASVTRIYGVRSAARQVYSELQNTRMSAVSENRSYTFTVDGGGASYSIGPTGATVSKPLDAASQGVTISAPNALTFTSTGTASSTATVTITNSAGDTTGVAVSPAGRVRIQ
jgi:prepilin-type N-terminal cleavage/methylation domain-containing protein